jgi:hypothetical protein
MNYYCTLFNSAYLLRGTTMLISLFKNDPSAFVYILAFDKNTSLSLKKIFNKNIRIIELEEFENKSLLSVKPSRSFGEYCWTCTSWLIKFCIEFFHLPFCTYVDADLFFFNNPDKIFPKKKSFSIFITPHYYSPNYDQSSTSGIYCVQFLKIRNTNNGMECLNWWADRCIEWCFNRYEDGKFGDQKYLDDWPDRFSGTYVLGDKSVALAPWNIQQHSLVVENNFLHSIGESKKLSPVFYYHFHDIKLDQNSLVSFFSYKLNENAINLIYNTYFNELYLTKILFDKHNINGSEHYLSLISIFLKEIYRAHCEIQELPSKYSIKNRIKKYLSFFY